jgi:hypothetical protein
MDVKPYTLEELFKNESFRKFAPYFLDEPRTILEVENLSGISRQTISGIIDRSFKQENGKYQYIEWSYSKKGKPFKIKVELLSAYLSEKLSLTEEEVKTLDALITYEPIQKAIVRGNIILDMALMKALAFTMAIAIQNQIEIEDPKYYERTKYFRTALDVALKKAPKSLMKDIRKVVPKGGNIPLPFGLDSLKNEASEPWLKEYIKNNRKSLESILVKMRSSTFHLVIPLSELYDNSVLRLGGVLYIKRQLEIGNKDWIEQYSKFRAELKSKKKKRGEAK